MIFELFNENCFKATCATDTSASTNQLKLIRSEKKTINVCLITPTLAIASMCVCVASEQERKHKIVRITSLKWLWKFYSCSMQQYFLNVLFYSVVFAHSWIIWKWERNSAMKQQGKTFLQPLSESSLWFLWRRKLNDINLFFNKKTWSHFCWLERERLELKVLI